MRRIAFANQKGGVGKTTSAVNLAAAMARLGRSVLLIDMDPQANATVHLGLKPHLLSETIYTVMTGRTTAQQAARPIEPNLSLIPANLDLAGAEIELSAVIGRESVLRDHRASLDGYDFILVDSPPSLGLLNVNALTFVQEVFIPLQCEFFALHGISLLMRTLDLVKRRLNPALEITGVMACMYDVRRALSKETVKEIEQVFGPRVFRSKVRTNVRLAEAPSHGKTIFQYAPDCYGAEDYLVLAREILGEASLTTEFPGAASAAS
jgi:chromosome partitioning protein